MIIEYLDGTYKTMEEYEEHESKFNLDNPFDVQIFVPHNAFFDMIDTGRLFETADLMDERVDINKFINVYMRSDLRRNLDKGDPRHLCNSHMCLFNEFMRITDINEVIKTSNKDYNYAFLEKQWIGEANIRLGVLLRKFSSDIIEMFPLEFMRRYYINGHLLMPHVAILELVEKGKDIIENNGVFKY